MIFDFIKRFWRLNPKLEFLGHAMGGIGAGGSSSPAISNSLRFRASASAYLSRTFGTPTNGKIWTLSLWVKKAIVGSTTRRGFFATTGTNDYFEFSDGGTADNIMLTLGNSSSQRLTTSSLYRDPSGFFHVCIGFDSTQGTAANRWSIEINGSTPPLATANYPALNYTPTINTAVAHYIGADYALTAGQYFDGVNAQICFVDGQKLAASSFAAADSTTGEWKPLTSAQIRTNVGTWGNNGFMLLFNDTSSTTTLGYDRQVSDTDTSKNNWTLNNFSLSGATYDALIDSPCNGASATQPVGNYATLNALACSTNITLSEANLLATCSANASNNTALGTIPITLGMKVYFEITNKTGTTQYAGVTDYNNTAPSALTASASSLTTAVTYYASSGAIEKATVLQYSGASWTANDVIGIAVDYTSSTATVQMYKNNSAQGSAVSITPASGLLWPMSITWSSAAAYINFGQRPFTYTPPTGYKALCTANLTTPAIPKPSDAFKVTLATGANIDANVASARSGWSGYVDIKKVRNTTGSWLWQFSHDSTKEYAVAASSLTYQAISSLSGANNYVGYSLRIGATYGTAAGSVSHTNGADTTVTHNVGVSARQLILLFSRAGGSVVKVYHPDLTSGKLLDLCSTAAEATSATIKTVTSTSFKIDTGTATGTYDYLVISEMAGLVNLFKFIGNTSTDGPFPYCGQKSKAIWFKSTVSVENWTAIDAARDTYNVCVEELYLNTNGSSYSGLTTLDDLSNGFKLRTANSSRNPANLNVGISFSDIQFNYANAR